MLRLVLKQTMAHRGRLLLTFAAITLGVTFVVGTLVLTDTSRKVFDDQFRDASTEVDIVVRDAVAFDAAALRRMAGHADGMTRFDTALVTLGLMKPDRAGRPMTDRAKGCLRLLRLQAIVAILQVAALVAAGWLVV